MGTQKLKVTQQGLPDGNVTGLDTKSWPLSPQENPVQQLTGFLSSRLEKEADGQPDRIQLWSASIS